MISYLVTDIEIVILIFMISYLVTDIEIIILIIFEYKRKLPRL